MRLRDYQINIANKGFEILRTKGIVYLVMSPRTGKTLTALHIASLCGVKKVLMLIILLYHLLIPNNNGNILYKE